MAFDTDRKRQRSWFFPMPWGSFPFPVGEIDDEQRAAIWSTYFPPGSAGHSPYYIADITGDTLSLMIEQFKRSDNLKGVIEVFTEQLEETNDQADFLIMKRLISTAEGVQLDGIGEIVGEDRQGRSDDDYRVAIEFKVFINVSSGQPDVVMTVLKTVTQATQVRLIEFFPAHIYLYTNGSDILGDLLVTMRKVIPAGVGLSIVAGYGVVPFEFDTEGGIPYAEGDGFSEYNYTEGGQPIGGQMVELIS